MPLELKQSTGSDKKKQKKTYESIYQETDLKFRNKTHPTTRGEIMLTLIKN